ncbi:MAG: DUF3847 domain-containing protein [Eubacteriales bacterium]|nr:DUF3847 domain-containing protein [Eubacteriales bacterium]
MSRPTLEELRKLRDEAQQEATRLHNRQKVLLSKQIDAERRARTRRLIERGAMLESVFPELTNCSNEKVMAFLSDVSRLTEINVLIAAIVGSDTGQTEQTHKTDHKGDV